MVVTFIVLNIFYLITLLISKTRLYQVLRYSYIIFYIFFRNILEIENIYITEIVLFTCYIMIISKLKHKVKR